jgi:hypothetical protein
VALVNATTISSSPSLFRSLDTIFKLSMSRGRVSVVTVVVLGGGGGGGG